MAQELLDNPAGRLRSLLLRLHEKYPQASNVLAWDAWNTVLAPGTSADSPELLTRFAAVLELPRAIRDTVEALDLEDDAYQAAPPLVA